MTNCWPLGVSVNQLYTWYWYSLVSVCTWYGKLFVQSLIYTFSIYKATLAFIWSLVPNHHPNLNQILFLFISILPFCYTWEKIWLFSCDMCHCSHHQLLTVCYAFWCLKVGLYIFFSKKRLSLETKLLSAIKVNLSHKVEGCNTKQRRWQTTHIHVVIRSNFGIKILIGLL